MQSGCGRCRRAKRWTPRRASGSRQTATSAPAARCVCAALRSACECSRVHLLRCFAAGNRVQRCRLSEHHMHLRRALCAWRAPPHAVLKLGKQLARSSSAACRREDQTQTHEHHRTNCRPEAALTSASSAANALCGGLAFQAGAFSGRTRFHALRAHATSRRRHGGAACRERLERRVAPLRARAARRGDGRRGPRKNASSASPHPPTPAARPAWTPAPTCAAMATPEKAHEERLTQELFDKARRRLPHARTICGPRVARSRRCAASSFLNTQRTCS
jgi:hypothetical protein